MEDLKLTPGVRSSAEKISVGVKLCSYIREVPIYNLRRDIGFMSFHGCCANFKLIRKSGHLRFLPNPLQFTIQ